MTAANWLQLLVLVALVARGARVLGPYLAGMYGDGTAPGRPHLLARSSA